MQLTNIPAKFPKPFAANASGSDIRTVPVTTSDPDAASLTLGFPPATMTSSLAGGVPPDGRDFNGILNQSTSWDQWFSIGGWITYDATMQAAIGGYPKYSVVGSVTNPGAQWQSTADNNTTNPDTGGAGWVSYPTGTAIPWASPPALGNVTPNAVFATTMISHGLVEGGTILAFTDLQINGIGFSESFGQTGYQRLPSTLIIQWGRFFGATGTDFVTFPLVFPNNCTVTTSASAANSTAQVSIAGGFNGFTCTTYVSGSVAAGVGVGWIAIGY